jgi:hypothetical protein
MAGQRGLDALDHQQPAWPFVEDQSTTFVESYYKRHAWQTKKLAGVFGDSVWRFVVVSREGPAEVPIALRVVCALWIGFWTNR